MENLKNLEKIAKIFQPQNIITSEEIDQVLKGIMEILASYKKGTDAINEETKAVVNILLDKVVQSNKQTIDKAETVLDNRMSDLETLLKDVKQMVTDVETMAGELEDGKDADEERIVEEVIARIRIPDPVNPILDTPETLRDKLASLKDEERLDKSAIKGLDKIVSRMDLDNVIATLQHQASFLINRGGIKSIVAGTNITVDNTDPSNPVVSSTGGGSPGGSTTQLQYNNAGAFGGISGATTNGTAVTYTTDSLIAANVKASGSGGFLIDSNSGTDVALFGAGGGAGATFYGGLTLNTMTQGSIFFAGASGLITQDNSNLFWDDTNNRLGIGTTSPAQALHVSSATTYQGIFVNGNVAPNISFAQSTGTTAEWKAGISGNSGTSFSISSGASATDRILINSSGLIGLNTNTNPTHTLTLSSTSTGIALYNTADQTTNYERVLMNWSSNQFIIEQRNGGTGVGRSLLLRATDNADGNAAFINIFSASNVKIDMGVSGSFGGETNLVRIGSGTSLTASTAITQRFLEVTGTINQSSSAAYTALLVNPTETTTGSGTKLLADFQVGGTSKHKIFNDGVTHFIMPDTSTSIFSTVSNSPGGTTGIEFRYNSVGGGTNIARIMAVVGTGGGGDINFDTASGGGSAYSTKATITRAGNFYVSGTLELGSTTDTTISRSSAGVIAVEGVVVPTISSTNTLTNKRITGRVQTVTSSATVTPSWDNDDAVTITAQAAGLTLANPSGTPTSMQRMVIRVKDNGTGQTIAYGTQYRAIGVTLPTTTVANKTLYMGGFWNAADSKVDVVAYSIEA